MATPTAPIDTMTLDRTDGSSTLELYRAALGPLRRDYYLKAFTRFDAVGKTGPSWNGLAAFFTLNWMVFRKLWGAALAYVGALVFVALLLGIGRLIFQLDEVSQWALAAFAMLAAIAVPGFFGNQWLYTALNKKIERALVGSATLEEACALLGSQTVGKKRMGVVAGTNIALAAAVVAIAVSWPDAATLPLNTSKMAEARITPADVPQSGLAMQSIAAAASAPPVAVAVAAPSVPVASAPALAVAQAEAAASTSRVSKGVVQAASAPLVPAPVAVPVEAAPEVAPKPLEKSKPAQASKATKTGKHSAPAQHKTETRAPAPPPANTDTYLINVGLFADENNARNASTKLKDAGLPVLSSTLHSAKGERTRVRVGPFETQAEADRAAEKIHALQLDAVVVKPQESARNLN